MTRQSARLIRLIACIAAMSQSAPSIGAQQSNPMHGFIPVQLVVPERAARPADRVQVVHNASDSSYVILLPGSLATSAGVYAGARAIRNLLLSKADSTAPSNQSLNVDVAGPVPARAGAIVDGVLARLRASAPRVDGMFGLVRSTVIYVRRPGVWRVVDPGGALRGSPPLGHP